MPDWAVATLKWVGAIVGMVLVVAIAVPRALDELSQAITFDDGGLISPETPEATLTPVPEEEEATASGEERAHTAIGSRNALVQAVGGELVSLGADGPDELLVAFDPLPADPACLTRVEFEVQLVESDETDVLVRPARVADLATLEEGDPLPADASVDGGEPSRAITSGAPGRLRWNVTIPYSIAAREAEPGTNVVLSVFLPPDSEAISTFATGIDNPDAAPSLAWTAVAGCADLEPTAPQTDEGQET